MVHKIKVAPAEPPEEVQIESLDQHRKTRDESKTEKLSTKNKVLYGVGIFTAIVALVLVVTLPIVLKSSPVAQQAQEWGDWADWSRCSSTCDQGQRSRLRFCGNGEPSNQKQIDCLGEAVEIESCHLAKCLTGRSVVKSTCAHLRQSLNINDNLFCDRYAQSVTLNGNVLNSVGTVERGYGIWRLTETDFKQILEPDYFEIVNDVCGNLPGFSPSNRLNDTLKVINEQPCPSAVALIVYLKIQDLLPISVMSSEQKAILERTSDHIMSDWDETIAMESQEVKNICQLADIDFEFVLDQSTSVGQQNWTVMMRRIADYWIDALQPSGVEKCGNHIAARKFSGAQYWDLIDEDKYHTRFLDFRPPPDNEYPNYSNYTEYVKFLFINESYMGGATHTAEALCQVNEEDIPMTRDGKKIVILFTDGVSNDPTLQGRTDSGWPILAEEAERLKNNVDKVFAYGIGTDVDPDELKLIASSDENWYILNDYESIQYAINMFILQHGGCSIDEIKPYRKVLETKGKLGFF